MKIDNVEKGKKANFETLEDLLQTFFCIAGAVYRVVTNDEDGVVELFATDNKGRIRVRIDYPEEGEEE